MDGSWISKIALEYSPKVEEMWDVQERDGHCEVGTSQKRWLWCDDEYDYGESL